jgi:hypothetical protein
VKDSKPTRIKTDQSSYALGITPLTIPKQSENELSVNVETLVNNQPNYIKKLYRQVSDVNSCNVKIIHDYIIAEETEINIQESTKGDKIKKLCLLSRYFDHRKSFSEMTKLTY